MFIKNIDFIQNLLVLKGVKVVKTLVKTGIYEVFRFFYNNLSETLINIFPGHNRVKSLLISIFVSHQSLELIAL